MQEIQQILPNTVHEVLQQEKVDWMTLEEIRLRIGQPIELLYEGHSILTKNRCTSGDLQSLLGMMSQHSIYRLEEELKQGYITIRGGHRIGLAGKVLTEGGVIKRIRDISSINIRITKEKIGCIHPLVSKLYEKGWKNTVFIGPPACGKTTLLRDLTRFMSYGDEKRNVIASKVGLVDERSEIAGCVAGIPQYDLGPRVDVLDTCPKAEGMMMFIRSMSPDVIVVDELGGKADVKAVQQALYAGVKIMLSAHGFTYDDFLSRPYMDRLAELGAFERFVLLSHRKGPGTIEEIRDGFGRIMDLNGKKEASLWSQ